MPQRQVQGFTLIELMVVIVIAAILTALAIPSFRDTIRTNRVATSANEALTALSLARMDAIRSTRATQVCPSANGTSCSTTASDWSKGLLVMVDSDNDDIPDSATRYIQTNQAVTVTVAGSSNNNQINFDGRGRLNNSGVDQTVTLASSTCPSGKPMRRILRVRAVGQVTMTTDACP